MATPQRPKQEEAAKLTDRQLATILHALRVLQESEGGHKTCTQGKCEHFAEVEELGDKDIDALCEFLNTEFEIKQTEDEGRYTNHYLCPNDNTRWDDEWTCMCNDRCPTCDAEIEPYASTDNRDQSETVHNQEVQQRANAVE